MSKLVMPERQVITEPDILENPSVSEFFIDGAVCRFNNGLVHILGFRAFDSCAGKHHEHTVTWHMPSVGFDPSFICAFWRWQENGPWSALGDKVMGRCH